MRTPLALACSFLLSVPVFAQVTDAADEAVVEVLRRHGLEHSQVMDHLSWICDVYGPRLTGSTNIGRAQQWALETFERWGLQNAHLEEWGPFGRGWEFQSCSAEVVGDNPWPVIAYPKAWSPSLPRVVAEVVDVSAMSADELDAADLTGKFVLVQETREVDEAFDAEAERLDAADLLALVDGTRSQRGRTRQRRDGDFRRNFARRGQVLAKVYEKRPAAILDRGSKGDYGTIFVQGASALPGPDGQRVRAQDPEAEVIPQFTLAVEHYNRIARLLAKKIPVRLALELEARYVDGDPMERNVLAEIPGSDPAIGDEVVMLGAHFDSWHSGTGATDNGCGSAVVMEAVRLLVELQKETGRQPRRTIRVALWSGEEQGLLGSRAYVGEHFASGGRGEPLALKPEHAKLSGYYNLDNGTGRIRGVYLQGNAACGPIFRAWLRPFHDLDASTITIDDTGGTDHQAFDGVGLPGFQFIQDPVAYSPRTHHSNMDNWDHAVASDLQQAATIMASFVWHTAQRDDMLPREPVPAPRDASGTTRLPFGR